MKSLNGVAVAALIAAVTTPAAFAQEAVQWRVEDGGNGHWYRVIYSQEIGNSQIAARAIAHQYGAELATFSSLDEWSFASSAAVALDTLGPVPKTMYLGGRLVDTQWQWLDGSIWPDGAPWFTPGVCPGVPAPNGDGDALQSFCEGLYWDDRPIVGAGILNKALFEWSADCNGDGIVDYGQILDGTFEDADGNGVPDCCDEGVSCDPCVGDVNNDGQVNGADISVLLGFWGLNGKPVAADINKDGSVDGADLAQLLGSWGECP